MRRPSMSWTFAGVGAAALVGVIAACVGDDPAPSVDTSGDSGASSTSSSGNSGASSSGASGGDGAPAPECEAGAKDCNGNVPRSCVGGSWHNDAPCGADDVNYRCVDGACVTARSCNGLLSTSCGTSPAHAHCCKSPKVDGAMFYRDYYPESAPTNLPATVSSYRLDQYLVTMARFRTFLQSGAGTKTTAPAAGAGAHPKIADSGWQSAWNDFLAADTATFKSSVQTCNGFPGATYADLLNSADNEKPINCVTWYEAFAFCAWDGGRLPTVAEFNLAQVGGTDERPWPWGDAGLDLAHANVCQNTSTPCTDAGGGIAKVGSAPSGAGRYGQVDLVGGMREYLLDIFTSSPNPCMDCAQLDASASTSRVVMGASWADSQDTVRAGGITTNVNSRTTAGGFRCARDL